MRVCRDCRGREWRAEPRCGGRRRGTKSKQIKSQWVVCWKIGRRYFISTLGLRLRSSMGTRADPQTVTLRHARTRDRDKPSIYSRYLKPNIFGFKNRTESADAAAVKRAHKSRSADKSRPEPEEAMSGARRLSYAERVKELLRQEPVIPARTQAQTCQRCLTKLRIGNKVPSPCWKYLFTTNSKDP